MGLHPSKFKISGSIRILIAILLLNLVWSCAEHETKISHHGDSKSHKFGEACMQCHVSGGRAEGNFVVAGSVVDSSNGAPFPNTTIHLFSELNGKGKEIATIEVDELGNFYTTADINLAQDIYPAIENASGQMNYMTIKLPTGNCNSCHGNTTRPIWAN